MNVALLKRILSQPSAPFRESHVKREITRWLAANRIRHFEDPIGNIVLGAGSPAEYAKLLATPAKEPLRIFIAHLDHPGFHGVKWLSPKVLQVKWHGGSPRRHLNGAKVWLADNEGARGEGVMSQAKLVKSGAMLEKAVIRFKQALEVPATSLFGGFAFRSPVWTKGKLVYTKAADDLVGAYVVTQLSQVAGKNFLGLLTRAEEVGFLGAIAHFNLGWWKKARRPLVAVSLETSRTLPGAHIGKGPVVRLGDRATPFDPHALQVLTQVAREALGVKYQRRIMDGGTCEGTVTTSLGIPTVGISVPLGNYHNQCFEGGPDARGEWGPAPEFVHSDDIRGMEKLCTALLKPGLPWAEPWEKRRREFRGWLKDYAKLMELR